MRHEAQNVIILGNLVIGNAGIDKTGWRDPANWFMAAVQDGDRIVLTALMTPPYNLTLYATENRIEEGALACLVHGMADSGVSIPGVMSEKSLAERFAEAYAGIRGDKYSVAKSLRLYELTKVNPEIAVNGALRLTRESDMAFLPYWLEGFNSDCFGESLVKQDAAYYQHEIDAKKVYVFENRGVPVSSANISRELQTLCCIGGVYTPPYFRREGYATSCVAALSQVCLERGFTKCVLYTDLANPISNSIYQKIGYVPISDSSDIKFV
jgi:predicted GNAT family acetyltransferase